MLRLVLIIVLWVLVTGTTVIKCSSGSDFRFDDENRAPVAADGFYQTASSSSVTGRMAATDPDDDPLTYRVLSGPSLGSLRSLDSNTGFFTYVPGQIGSDQFTFQASDGRRSSNTATVNILVTLQNVGGASVKAGPPLAAAHADPLDPGALLLHWAPPASRVERLSDDGIDRELLASDVASLMVDAARPGRLAVRDADGDQRVSIDGGRRWHPAEHTAFGSPAEQVAAGEVAAGPAGLVPAPLARGQDPFARDVHLVVVRAGQHSEVWRSLGAGPTSLLTDGLPGPADDGQLLADLRTPDRWFLRLDQDVGTRIYLSQDGGTRWDEIMALNETFARMIDCAPGVCVLSEDGHRLWRIAPTVPARPD